MEVELVRLNDELDSKVVQEKFEKSSIILNNIIKCQRNPCIKTCIGFVQKGNNDSSRKINNQPYSYVEALLKHSMKKEKIKSIGHPSKNSLLPVKKETKTSNEQGSKTIVTPQKKALQIRYPYNFHGYCFACSQFRHKAKMCRAYGRHPYETNSFNSKNNQIKTKGVSRNYNSFYHLQDLNIEFFRCHNLGHKASNCRLMKISEKPKKFWKETT